MAPIDLPPEVASLLSGLPTDGQAEQAFPFLTVDEAGFPHVCLLSRAQVEPRPAGLLALVGSRRTRANLLRAGAGAGAAGGLATLIAVAPTAAHYCKLRLIRSIDERWALAAAFDLVEHKADQSPVPLTPLTYVPNAEVEAAEQWERGGALLRKLLS